MLALGAMSQLHTLQIDSLLLAPPEPHVQGMAGAAAAAAVPAAAPAQHVAGLEAQQHMAAGIALAAVGGMQPLAPQQVPGAPVSQPQVLQLHPGAPQQVARAAQPGAAQQAGAPAAAGVTTALQVPHQSQPAATAIQDVWGAGLTVPPSTATSKPPAWAALAAHYAGLQLPSVRTLIITGVHTYRGELGAVFPNVDALAVACVDTPPAAAMPPAAVPMRRLTRLAWPAGRAVPQLLAACPVLAALTLTSVTSSSRLEESLALVTPVTPPVTHTAATATATASDGSSSAAITSGGTEPVAGRDVPAAGASQQPVDEASAARSGSGSEAGAGACCGLPPTLTHLALALQGGSQSFKPKQLRTTIENLPLPLRTQLRSMTLRDQPPAAAAAARGRVTSRSGSGASPGAGTTGMMGSAGFGGLSLALAAHQPHPLSLATQAAALEAAASLETEVDGGVGEEVEGVFGSLPTRTPPASFIAPSSTYMAAHCGAPAAGFGHGVCAATGPRRRSMGCREAAVDSSGASLHHMGPSCSSSVVDGTAATSTGSKAAAAPHYDPAALAVAGKLVDEQVLVGLVGAVPGLRSLRIEGAGALTGHGLQEGVRTAGARLERLVVVGCPRLGRGAVEGLGAQLGRPWLRASWLP